MPAWVKMVVAVVAMLLPGGLILLIAYAVGRAWLARVREAALSGSHDHFLALKALSRVQLRDVVREARQMASLRMAPARV